MTLIKEESKGETEEKFTYSCKKCRKLLFTEENLEEHMSIVKGYNTRSHSLKVSHIIP